MRQTFGQYTQSVDLFIHDLTDGVVDRGDLIDFADGNASIGDCFASGITPRQCAINILKANGFVMTGAFRG